MPELGRPLTASGRRLVFSTSSPGRIKDEPWQDKAWDAYDRVPAVGKSVEWRRNVARKIDYFIATKSEETEDPEIVEDGPAVEALEQQGGSETIRRVVTDLVTHWAIVGEAHVVSTDETWQVYSTQELRKASRGSTSLVLFDDENNALARFDESQVYRIWRPHPRFRTLARSPLRPLLDTIEEWILLSREMRARGISRLPAGILFISQRIDLGDPENPDERRFDEELLKRMTRPIQDPGSADALVPWVVAADIEDWDKFVKYLRFDRDYQVSADMRQELLRLLASGVNLPPQVVMGMEGLNDWSAWQVADESIRQYADPDLLEVLESLTESWYWPILQAANVPNFRDFILYRDLSPAVVPADRSGLAATAYELMAISGEAYRRESSFDETDAPSPEEIEERIRIAQAIKAQPGIPIDTSSGRPGSEMRSAIVAAVPETISGRRLREIDQELLAYVVAQAEAAIDSALEAAGRRLRASVQGNGMRDLVTGVSVMMVAPTLGPDRVHSLFQSAEDLVPPSVFAATLARIQRRIEAAQAAVRDELEALTGEEVSEEPAESRDRDTSIAMILAALIGAALGALFTPDPSPDPADLGEVGDARVPVVALREALSVAGGGRSEFTGPRATELIGNGARAQARLELAGLRTLSFRWVYGLEPRKEFPPHLALDNEEFDSWESEGLSVDSAYSWLGRSFYHPGDHRGCRCSYERILSVSVGALPIAATSMV